MLRWYQSKLAKRPILTASVTSAVRLSPLRPIPSVLSILSLIHNPRSSSPPATPLAQQAVDRRGLEKHDFARTGRMALYGGAVFGPVATKWFGILQRHVVLKTTLTTTLARVGFSPLDKLKHSWLPAYKANCMVWPFVQGVNFTFVPLELRVLVVNVISLGWNCFLSLMNSDEV
ncbi:hypothetical protein N7509_008053 [Penicillium cosmopolitanum]|uniref:Uncharacterized protein n=1 Tax=Penicillium cosmopolitanum TaxID=1131564 RepID=A0A9W9W043_9EURO|nr:uncharacterized protein N7509_008053 [Penicillium cosmopolitanum]KAJ5392563.1 hypothetical protein N7509_008053 [Penicillium cosmopolitanum]